MYDPALAREIIRQMLEAVRRIQRRTEGLSNPNDFVSSDEGLDKLDAICMMLIAIGESCKQLDKHTDGQLLTQHPEIDWKGVKGIRAIMSHHYFDINAEVIYAVCHTHIPKLNAALERMYEDLYKLLRTRSKHLNAPRYPARYLSPQGYNKPHSSRGAGPITCREYASPDGFSQLP